MRHTVNFSMARRLLAALCLVLVAAGASAQFSGSGSGTADDPYRIYNAAQLNQVRNFLNDPDVVFSLESDIDMTDWIADNNPVQGWSPIGNNSGTFNGTFNGNGHTISNLWIKRPETDYIGLFGYAGTSSEIHDLTLTNARYEGKDYVGGIIGYLYNSGKGSEATISNCKFLQGNIIGGNYLGGIIGYAEAIISNNREQNSRNSITIENCVSECKIIGNDYIGGIVGNVYSFFSHDKENFSSTVFILNGSTRIEIDKCTSNSCIIKGKNYIGGIAGYYKTSAPTKAQHDPRTTALAEISQKYCISNNCSISGNDYIGGSVGYIRSSSVKSTSYYDSNTASCNIAISYSSNTINGTKYIGGLVGYVYNNDVASFHRNYAVGSINGESNLSGLVGYANGCTINYCYSKFNYIKGTENVSGLLNGEGSVSNSVAINTEISAADELARIGTGSNISYRNNLAWTLTSMVLDGVKQPIPADDGPNGTSTGLSTLQMQATYEGLGWDFGSTWAIQEGESFPYLQTQTAPPYFSQDLKAGETQITGQCTEGGTVTVMVGDSIYEAQSSGNTWSVTVPPLHGGDVVSVSVQAADKMPSYSVYATVTLPGNGTEQDPYLIATADDLQAITSMEGDAPYFKLTADIDLTEWIAGNNDGNGWIPVGGSSSGLRGHFDGDGHTISGLWTDETYEYGGLFAKVTQGAEVKDLHVEIASGHTVSGTAYAGGIAGINDGSISGCTVAGDISGGQYAGGIAGLSSNKIHQCRHDGQITASHASANVGGIAGSNSGEISECKSEGSITAGGASAQCGGIAGSNGADGNIHDCYGLSDVSASGASSYAGGVVGYNSGITGRCYSAGNIAGATVAGVCGYNSGASATLGGCVAINNRLEATKTALRMLGGYSSGSPVPAVDDNYALSTMQVSLNGIPQTVYDDPLNGKAMTMDLLQSKSTYEEYGWDFNETWSLDEGTSYPYLKVFDIPVTSVKLNFEEYSIDIDSTMQLTVTVLPEDARNKAVKWTSTEPEVATVSADGLVKGISAGKTTITATSVSGENVTASCTITVLPRKASSISIDRKTIELELESSDTLTATVYPEDADDKSVTWKSNSPKIAQVDQEGRVTALSVGTAIITATTNDGTDLKATCQVTVIPKRVKSITINEGQVSIERTKTAHLSVIIQPEDAGDKSVTWSSDNDVIAKVDDKGIVTAVAVGTTTITATTNDGSGLTAECQVTVTPLKATGIKLDKTEVSLERDATVQLAATVTPDDADDRTVIWSSDDNGIALVDDSGRVTAISVGTTTITATTNDGSNLTASCTVTVTPKTVQSITISEEELTLEVDESTILTATVYPQDADDASLTWRSNNAKVATVEDGKITAIATGTAVITVTSNDGSNIIATCQVTVIPKRVKSIIINEGHVSIERTKTAQLSVTIQPEDAGDKSVAWSSGNSKVATVDGSGLVTAVAAGTAIIRATTNDGSNLTAECQVTVTPLKATGISIDRTEATLERDATLQLTATVTPDDADDRTVTWSSADSGIARVDGAGLVTAVSVGTTTITATTGDGTGLTASCTVTVTPKTVQSITMDEEALNLERGETTRLTVVVTPQDADDVSVTWRSNNSSVATVDDGGRVTAIEVGTAVITATTNDGSGLSAKCTVTVTPKEVDDISINKETLEMEIGDIEQLTVVISPADADDKTVTWHSADAKVASVNSDGVVTARKAGETTITATTSNGLTAECQVEVTDPNGIYSPNADDVKVTTQKDRIIVEGLPAGWHYSVHDMSGRTVYIGSDTEVPVTGGNVYVVQIKDSTRKLLVP